MTFWQKVFVGLLWGAVFALGAFTLFISSLPAGVMQ